MKSHSFQCALLPPVASRDFAPVGLWPALTLLLVAACSPTASQTSPESASPSTAQLPASAAFQEAPIPPKAAGNPFSGAKLWVNPHTQAAEQLRNLKQTAPDQAAALHRVADQPTAVWLGEWSGDVKGYVQGIVKAANGELPLFVIYNVPYRDCGNYSKGGVSKGDDYRRWVREVAAGLGDTAAAVIVEPDALGLLDKCLNQEQQAERLALVHDAVRVLRQSPKVSAYIDAGHAHWVPVATMAERLKQAGIEDANGFALNTSNYVTTAENVAYGDELSKLVGGAHYVIDTSRNGNGAAPKDEWCNPSGRKIGATPTTTTGNPLVDAWLWIKLPGESDGECNGGPSAGKFWLKQALELAAP